MRRSQVTDIFERWKEDISTEPGSRENTKKDLINKFLFASNPLISIFEQTAHYNMRPSLRLCRESSFRCLSVRSLERRVTSHSTI